MKNGNTQQIFSNKTFSNNLPNTLSNTLPQSKIKSNPQSKQSKNQKSSKSRAMLTPLQIFEKLCEIPHRSYHTQKMFNYLCTFCKNLGLEVRTDGAKNIYVCKKPKKSSPKGRLPKNHLVKNDFPKICLQAHYDMVGVGKAQSGEGVEPYVDKQFLRAKDSSLGADNGAGLASILWLFMQEKYAPHIEAIFTNDEEVGLCGANELELPIKSRFLLNVDSEFFGEIITGCAGGFDVEFDFDVFEFQKTSGAGQNILFYPYEIESFGFEGGHSGVDIHRNIRSSIVEFAHLLQTLCEIERATSSFFCELYSLNAGEKSNSIPVGLSAFMGFSSDIDALKNALKSAGLCVRKENLHTLRIGLLPNDMTKSKQNLKTGFLIKYHRNIEDYQQILEQKPKKCYDKKLLSTLILKLRHGVWERGENAEVISSLNIAMIKGDLSFGTQAKQSKNTRIVGESGIDFSQNNNPPSLSEGVRGRVESTLESSTKTNAESSLRANDSERGNPIYNKNKITCHDFATFYNISNFRNDKIDSPSTNNYQNMAEGSTNDRKNPPSLSEGVRGRVESTLESSTKTNAESSLRDLPTANRGNPKPCHIERSEISKQKLQGDISAFSKPQYDKKNIDKTITCHANASPFARNDSINPPALHFTLKARANTNPLLEKIKNQTTQTIAKLLANPRHTASPNISNEYSAWTNASEHKTNKIARIHPILQMIIDAYKWRHCAVGSIHAGLECGILQERFSQMGLKNIAMASIGPTILSPHSLQERLDIDSFYEFVEVLESLIANICASKINN